MKIDFIISSLRGGGAERVLTILANNFSKNKDFDVSIITLFDQESKYELSSKVKRLVLNKNKNLIGHTLGSIISLLKYYNNNKNRPDIIISFITLTNFIAIVVAKIYSIKIIAQEHTNYFRYMKGRKILTKFTKKYVYRYADRVTVLTEFDIDYYKKYGVKVLVMPNPCSFDKINNYSNKREKIILAVGTLDRYHVKGFDNLIDLITPVLNQNPDWRLKIVGSGEQGHFFLKNLAEQKGISDKVLFTGFVSDISKLMKNSAIFVLSSRNEGLPMVLIEAMSQGMACIAYDCITGPRDIIEDNKNGLLIEDQNASKMRQGLNELINNDLLREKLSFEGIKTVDKYHISKISRLYDELFKKLLLNNV